MKSIWRLLPILVLFILAIIISPGVRAQSLDQSYMPQLVQNGNDNLVAPIDQTEITHQSLPAPDWRWVLPLLIIGIGVLLLGGSRERRDRQYYSPSRDFTVAYHDIRGERKRKKRQLIRLKKPLKAA